MALGDVAGHVDPAEEEGQPLRARALERREPVAGLFEAHAETLAQPVDIVADVAGGVPERAIGHQQRAGGIVGEADAEQLARGGEARPDACTTCRISFSNS